MIHWSAESPNVRRCSQSSSTFFIWRLYKLIILCFEICSGFRLQKIIIIIMTFFTCKLSLRVSQGTVATFYRCGGQSYNCLFPILSWLHIPKIIKIGLFLTELLKIKMSSLFETRCLRALFGPPLAAMRYVMYFRFCGWRHNRTFAYMGQE